MMNAYIVFVVVSYFVKFHKCRDEDKIAKACLWPNEMFEPCFGGCAEISCDNPRNHLRPCYPYCEPGCVCEEPYVRDDRTHQCVLPQDCSPTQMGIPVPSRRVGKPTKLQKPPSPQRIGNGKSEDVFELNNNVPNQVIEDAQAPAEVSRMGNYFNIVIAPPPIKTIQPRKMMQSEAKRMSAKRNLN